VKEGRECDKKIEQANREKKHKGIANKAQGLNLFVFDGGVGSGLEQHLHNLEVAVAGRFRESGESLTKRAGRGDEMKKERETAKRRRTSELEMFGSAPAARRARTISVNPLLAAKESGVQD
jgi:hypothetical protein